MTTLDTRDTLRVASLNQIHDSTEHIQGKFVRVVYGQEERELEQERELERV